jgi:hypothetical protein
VSNLPRCIFSSVPFCFRNSGASQSSVSFCQCFLLTYLLYKKGKKVLPWRLNNHGVLIENSHLRYRDSTGTMRVHGGPGLKQTQLYTPEFGRAMAAWWMAHGPVTTGTDTALMFCLFLNTMVRKANDSCVSQPGYRRERRRWSLVQSANLSLDAMKVGV